MSEADRLELMAVLAERMRLAGFGGRETAKPGRVG
jgi:hypothetical protein